MNLEQWKNSTLKNYQTKYKPSTREVGHILDYLKAHPKEKLQRASYLQILKKSERWTKKLNKKNANLKDCGKYRVIKRFPGGFKFIRLTNQTARNWEGRKMGNCVASYEDESEIYSLRDKDHIPHVTFEVENQRVLQMVGHSNEPVSDKYLPMALDAIKDFKICDNIIYDQFISLNKSDVKFLKQHFLKAKIYTFNKKTYAKEGQELTLIKPFKSKSVNIFSMFAFGFLKCPEAIPLFFKNKVKIDPSDFYHLSEDMDRDTLVSYLKQNNYNDPRLWKEIDYVPIFTQHKKIIKSHFEAADVIELKNNSFIKKGQRLTQTKALKHISESFLNLILDSHLVPDALIEYLDSPFFSLKLQESTVYKLQDFLFKNSFSSFNSDWQFILKNHFTGHRSCIVNGRTYYQANNLKMTTPFKSVDLEFLHFLVINKCLEAVICILKNLKSLSLIEKDYLLKILLKGQSEEAIHALMKIPSTPAPRHYTEIYPLNEELMVTLHLDYLALKGDPQLFRALIKYGMPSAPVMKTLARRSPILNAWVLAEVERNKEKRE